MNDENFEITLPTSGARIADFQREGRRWGAWMAGREIKIVTHAERLGVLTEDVHDKIISPGFNKDWEGTMSSLRLMAGATDVFIEAFKQAAMDERLRVLAASLDSKA